MQLTSFDPLILLYFGTFVVLILLQIPISYAMLLASLEYLVINHESFIIFAQKSANSFADFNMLALPSFLFVGCYMNEVGLTDRLFAMLESWLGHLKGGLAHANVLASMVFAGMSGSALADAGGLGTIEVKAMTKAGYDKNFSIAVTAASAGIGPIIPPSINFVIWAFLSQTSTMAMFEAGYIPGIIMGVSMMIWIVIAMKIQNIPCPKTKRFSWREKASATWSAMPALGGPIILVAGITTGVFTPAECGTVAAMYCVAMSLALRRFNWGMFTRALRATVASTGMVMCLCAAGMVFNWLIVTSGITTVVTDALMALNNRFLILLLLNLLLLFMGCFIGAMQIEIMMAPLLMNIATALGMSYVQMGVMVVLNITIGIITPPFAPALFVTCKATNGHFDSALKYTVQFLIPLFVTLMLVAYVPQITEFLPRLLGTLK